MGMHSPFTSEILPRDSPPNCVETHNGADQTTPLSIAPHPLDLQRTIGSQLYRFHRQFRVTVDNSLSGPTLLKGLLHWEWQQERERGARCDVKFIHRNLSVIRRRLRTELIHFSCGCDWVDSKSWLIPRAMNWLVPSDLLRQVRRERLWERRWERYWERYWGRYWERCWERRSVNDHNRRIMTHGVRHVYGARVRYGVVGQL